MTAKLKVSSFERRDLAAEVRSDPHADTPMVLTLDELRPSDLNPRVTRNPRHDDIKASILARGLDDPPGITRRPNDSYYVIRNGGNTRLGILRELWAETKQERFFRVLCLFRPWSPRGEIVALTGHLVENELRGELTFIERALAVHKARELYEREAGAELTQSELALQLTRDGYPVTQPHISRMQDAVRYLLPAIPSILYAGLGKPQIERLSALRKAAARLWEHHATGKSLTADFPTLFQEVLAGFEVSPSDFSIQRVQDELIGQMATLFDVDYDGLALEIVDAEPGQRALSREIVLLNTTDSTSHRASVTPDTRQVAPVTPSATPLPPSSTVRTTGNSQPLPQQRHVGTAASTDSERPPERRSTPNSEKLQGHIVSPAETTERLQSIERTIAVATGEQPPDFQSNVLRAIPVQAGSLYPISDVWYVEPGLDSPERLRTHIAQFAREIAHEAGAASCIESEDDGLGFTCFKAASSKSPTSGSFARAVLSLLGALSSGCLIRSRSTPDGIRLHEELAPLLLGTPGARQPVAIPTRLSDAGLVKLFRLIRLARRLIECESGMPERHDGRH